MDFMRVESMTNAELLEEFKWLEHMQDCIVMMPEYLIRFEELDHEMTRREELQLLLQKLYQKWRHDLYG